MGKFKFSLAIITLIIFLPTAGVIAKNTHLLLSTIFWLFFSITILLNLFFNPFEIFLFRKEIKILSYLIDDLQIPVITDEVIFPDPIKPKFILSF